MSRFGNLLSTNEVHSAFEEESSAVSSTPEVVVDTPPTPPVLEEPSVIIEEPSVVVTAFTNPLDTMPIANNNSYRPNFKKMTKIELEEYGWTVGIELDRRLSQKKLVKQLKEHIGSVDIT